MQESDPHWRNLYELVNNSAKPRIVGVMRHGFRFVLVLLNNAEPPSESELEKFASLPEPAKKACKCYVNTVLTICYEGSIWLRIVIKATNRCKLLKQWLETNWPKEVTHYRGFTRSKHLFALPN